MSELRFYFDESVELAVSIQLAAGGIDAVSVHSLDRLGDTDVDQPERATGTGRVLCTYDTDFLTLAAQGVEHAGIVFAPQRKATIGGWVRELRALHGQLSAEAVASRVI